MAFVYNNKLPFYSWGNGGSTLGSTSANFHPVTNALGRVVPTDYVGPQSLYDVRYAPDDSRSVIKVESTPCDAQMPWKQFVSANQYVFGLTIHGEVYQFENPGVGEWATYSGNLDQYYRQLSRRMKRIVSKSIRQPFSRLCLTHQSVYSNGDYYLCIAIARDGTAHWIVNNYSNRDRRTEQIDLPSGEQAAFVYHGRNPGEVADPASYYLLTTQTNKTYVRRCASLDSPTPSGPWIQLTTGVVEKETLNAYDGLWAINNLPGVTVEAPPGGGTTATARPIWQDSGSGVYAFLENVIVTSPGSGYTASPSVSVNRPADQRYGGGTVQTPTIALKVFGDYVDGLLGGSAIDGQFDGVRFRTASGKSMQLQVPTLSGWSNFASYPENFWTFDKTPTTNNGSSEVPINVSEVSPSVAWEFGYSAWVIDKSGNLYKKRTTSGAGAFELIDSGPWVSLTSSWTTSYGRVFVGVKEDGSMYSWGTNGDQYSRDMRFAWFGDNSPVGTVRNSPVQIAAEAEWVSAHCVSNGFIAIRKDAICRSIDQPMEYWPDWYFEQQTT